MLGDGDGDNHPCPTASVAAPAEPFSPAKSFAAAGAHTAAWTAAASAAAPLPALLLRPTRRHLS